MSASRARASSSEELKQSVDFNENKAASGGSKPSIASKLEKESKDLVKKRASLSKDDVDTKLKEAEERRQGELKKRVETAKELEGECGKVDPKAAAKDAPPTGTELPHSPIGKGSKKI